MRTGDSAFAPQPRDADGDEVMATAGGGPEPAGGMGGPSRGLLVRLHGALALELIVAKTSCVKWCIVRFLLMPLKGSLPGVFLA